MASDDFTLGKWYERNPKYKRSNANAVAKKMKQDWSISKRNTAKTGALLEPRCPCTSATDFMRSINEKYTKSANEQKSENVKQQRKEKQPKWTEMRQQRQAQRRYIISELNKDDGGGALDSGPPLTWEAQTLVQYRHFIEFGSDVSNIAPMDKHLLDLIYKYTPQHKQWITVTAVLFDEVRADYDLAIRKSIVDFALKDASAPPRMMASGVRHPNFSIYNMFSNDLNRQSYVKRFKENRQRLNNRLNSINLCIVHMSKIWQKNYAHISLVGMVAKRTEPLALAVFTQAIAQQIEHVKTMLKR